MAETKKTQNKPAGEITRHEYDLVSKYKPAGSQPEAIAALVKNIREGAESQVLLGVTGSGKTFTMANVINELNRPALVIAHNKTLAAQLCNEFRAFFPHNRVEYFVSYYDYYQPEAYISSTDTYIEKDMAINDEIDKLRHSATCALSDRRDVIIVASVSCIYGLGAPKEYFDAAISLRPNEKMERGELVKRLCAIQYTRAGENIERSTFRVKGDTVDIIPSHTTTVVIRVSFNGDVIERLYELDALTMTTNAELNHAAIFPASHYVIGSEKLGDAIKNIRRDLDVQLANFKNEGKMIEEHRLRQRTNYDIEMIQEMGYCNGIENYSRYFDGRTGGEPPYTLMSYFPNDFVTFIDESHITVPQIRGMYNGDRARKTNLVDFGFRLPSAYDNRPLNFAEFNKRLGQTVYVSATPADYEIEKSGGNVVEQIIRPTGLLDPQIVVQRKDNQINDLLAEIRKITANKTAPKKTTGKILVTTLTKKMAEDLTAYFTRERVRVRYLHSEIDTLERVDIITALRKDEFDVIVGINLLREGLDIPEVELVAILDADKEGLFRSKRSLIQTIGRAARNANARVILYANEMTESMRAAIDETDRRRKIQSAYNSTHGITPHTVYSAIQNTLYVSNRNLTGQEKMNREQKRKVIDDLTAQMNMAAKSLDFESAIKYREEITRLKKSADAK
jgi:excinuclease ABC subunit B